MKMYVETDNRLIKENDESKKNSKKDIAIENKKNAEILESYGLSKNAQILTE